MTGRQIQDLRNRLGWTQEKFGRVLGVDKSTISLWERGIQGPNPAAVKAMRVLDRAEEEDRQKVQENFAKLVTAGGLLWIASWLSGDSDES